MTPASAAVPTGPSLHRRLRRRFYWLLTLLLLGLADLLPLAWGRRLGVGLARFAARIRPRERSLATANLTRAFPELDTRTRQRLLDESVTALGRTFFDTLSVPRLLRRDDAVVEIPYTPDTNCPIQETIAELRDQGRGVLLLGSHLGCWELLGAWLARGLWSMDVSAAPGSEMPLAVVTGTVHNEPVNRLIQDRRAALGLETLPREDGVVPLVRHLRKGGVAAVLLDQYTRVQNVSVPFFGHDAPTPAGFGRLALRWRIPVLPVGIAFNADRGRYEVGHLAPLRPEEIGIGEDDESRLHAFLSACNLAVETMIRRNPSQWVWFHRRWR